MNQVLELAIIDSGDTELRGEEFDLSVCLTNILFNYREIADAKDITLHFESNPELIRVFMDKKKIERIFINILSNSLKFIKEDGTITVELIASFSHFQMAGDKEDGSVQITVTDTGVGIPEEQLPHIFERFRQADGSLTREFGGAGIGLSLVKEYLSLCEGEIIIKSKVNQGTIVTILLPFMTKNKINRKSIQKRMESHFHLSDFKKRNLAEKEITSGDNIEDESTGINRKAIGKEHQLPEKEKKIILIIEDNRELQECLSDYLKTHYIIFTAYNGAEALRTINLIPKPHIILSDIMMDVMDGYSFFNELKKDARYNDVPFIFITARGSEKDKIEGLTIGAVDYIIKPFAFKELELKIKSILSVQKAVKKRHMKEFKKKIKDALFSEEDEQDHPATFLQLCESYHLTRREREIVTLILRGKENKEIAGILCVSEHTVKNHNSEIYKKCKVNNRIELMNIFSPGSRP